LRISSTLLAILVFHPLASVPGAELSALRAAAGLIKSDELKAHVDVLADDAFEGREAGTRGGHAAAGYLVKLLQARSLRPAGEKGSYFQSFGHGYRNVLGLLEGSDPELKREIVVLGAHYDHVGYGSRSNSFGPWGYVHNGADDNASGISGLLETIDAMLAVQPPPRRSVLFAFFDGEEKGLLGSKQWMDQPTVPGGHIACMINVDMIGRMRNDRIEVYGTRSARGLRRLVTESNALTGLALDFTWEMKENSDHYSFFSHRIPTLMLHTGLHPDYHRPSDDSHQLNLNGMEQAARFLFALAYELATRPALAPFRQESYGEHPGHRDMFERLLPESQPRLGVTWARETGAAAGLVVQSVARSSAAERAGLRVGDRIVDFGGRPVTDVSRFRLEILAAAKPVPMTLQRANEPEPVTVQVALSGSPTRVGIAWKEDEAEPGTVMLTHVVYGSAADQAGLAGLDRIYAVAGQPFKNGSELHQLLTSLPSPIDLLMERNGRLRTVSLQVLPLHAE
jgi:hypothetical protein